nr:hypothetical protein NCPCFENI_01324 [Cupriavidus sp.]
MGARSATGTRSAMAKTKRPPCRFSISPARRTIRPARRVSESSMPVISCSGSVWGAIRWVRTESARAKWSTSRSKASRRGPCQPRSQSPPRAGPAATTAAAARMASLDQNLIDEPLHTHGGIGVIKGIAPQPMAQCHRCYLANQFKRHLLRPPQGGSCLCCPHQA